ncbi:unnamed protein product [Sympodiomycopsis kandeliae]
MRRSMYLAVPTDGRLFFAGSSNASSPLTSLPPSSVPSPSPPTIPALPFSGQSRIQVATKRQRDSSNCSYEVALNLEQPSGGKKMKRFTFQQGPTAELTPLDDFFTATSRRDIHLTCGKTVTEEQWQRLQEDYQPFWKSCFERLATITRVNQIEAIELWAKEIKASWQQRCFRPVVRPLWDPATQHRYLLVQDRAAGSVLDDRQQVWKWAAQFSFECHANTADPVLATFEDIARLVEAVFVDPAYLELTDTQVCLAAQLMTQASLACGQPLLGLASMTAHAGVVQPDKELLEDVVSSTLSPLAIAHLYDLFASTSASTNNVETASAPGENKNPEPASTSAATNNVETASADGSINNTESASTSASTNKVETLEIFH